MSKVAIQGNASGTGTFTIAAPNSNTDRTLTLPDEAGTVLSSGTPLSSFPSGFANGITEADNWRLTATLTLSSTAFTVITANLERSDTTGFGYLGTGMTESSGIFTFPSTGVWQVFMHGVFYGTQQTDSDIAIIQGTTNNSTYTTLAYGRGNNPYLQSQDTFSTISCTSLFDVTDTANCKVRFAAETNDATQIVFGSSVTNTTSMLFIRLGDT